MWDGTTNDYQNELKEECKVIASSNKLFVPADKTSNFYKMENEDYDTLVTRDVMKDYVKTDIQNFNAVTKDDKRIASKFDIADRVFKTSPVEAFVNLKDTKPIFQNNLPTRI